MLATQTTAPYPTPSPWAAYRRLFEANATRPLPAVAPVTPHQAALLPAAEILARFQLGESGEGRLAHEIDRAQLPDADGDYRRALKLVVREEGRHGRVLGAVVLALGGKLLRRKASNTLFTWARRLVGVRFKLAVVVVAEVVGQVVYRALAERLAALPGAGRALPDVTAALAELARDEEAHLRFHADFMQTLTHAPAGARWTERVRRRVLRAALSAAVGVVGVAANAVVFLENRAAFRALGLSPWCMVHQITRSLASARVAAFAGARPLTPAVAT